MNAKLYIFSIALIAHSSIFSMESDMPAAPEGVLQATDFYMPVDNSQPTQDFYLGVYREKYRTTIKIDRAFKAFIANVRKTKSFEEFVKLDNCSPQRELLNRSLAERRAFGREMVRKFPEDFRFHWGFLEQRVPGKSDATRQAVYKIIEPAQEKTLASHFYALLKSR